RLAVREVAEPRAALAVGLDVPAGRDHRDAHVALLWARPAIVGRLAVEPDARAHAPPPDDDGVVAIAHHRRVDLIVDDELVGRLFEDLAVLERLHVAAAQRLPDHALGARRIDLRQRDD